MAVVTSFRNFARNFGGTIGLAVAGTILNNLVRSAVESLSISGEDANDILKSPQTFLSNRSSSEADQIRAAILPAYRKGFRIIFLIGSALAALAFVLAWFLMPQAELDRPDDQKLKEEGKKWHEEAKK